MRLSLYKKLLEIFIKSLRFKTPWVGKNGFNKSVCRPVSKTGINNRANVDPTLDTNVRLSAESRNDNDVLRWYNTGFQRFINTGKQHIFNLGYQPF